VSLIHPSNFFSLLSINYSPYILETLVELGTELNMISLDIKPSGLKKVRKLHRAISQQGASSGLARERLEE